jgi:Purple acid Phosphatase, N-terminal domain
MGAGKGGQQFSRRQVLSTAGLAAVAVPLAANGKVGTSRKAAALVRRAGAAGAPQPEQLHVQFGAEAAQQVAVSWATPAQVSMPRLRLGTASGGHGTEVPAQERVYTEALTGETVWTYHATLNNLLPGTTYIYEVLHDGATPVPGMFRTGPRGRSRGFRFTSFGDQAVPAAVGLGLGPHTPNAGFIVPAVESLDPLFHLFNGDLCYANVSDAPVQTWQSFFTNNARSAANRSWMPSAGNHENEVGNGPQGYLSYQTRFELPDNGSAEFRGNWYAFTVGSIRVISSTTTTSACRTAGSAGSGATTSRRMSRIATTLTSTGTALEPSGPGWRMNWPVRVSLTTSTGSWCACTRSRCPRRTSMVPTSGSGSSGCRCSTRTGST